LNTSNVFVSTGCFREQTGKSVAKLLNEGIRSIELSGGVPYPGLVQEVENLGNQSRLQLHNYFPPADPPFVFNLASPIDAIRSRTIQSMNRALELSARIGADRYSIHAGFLVDPPISFLGASWQALDRTDISEAQRLFIESTIELRDLANRLGVRLLIENNVLTTGTKNHSGGDVLLMATSEQIVSIMKQLPNDIGLLMDVAHLKVTARTEGLDPLQELALVSDYTLGYHLSDNDGRTDANGPVSRDSWFWSALQPNVEFATLEVAPSPGVDFLRQVEVTEELWQGGQSL